MQYAVGVLCSFAQYPPDKPHLDAAISVIAYLYNTRNLGITYGGKLKSPISLSEPPRYFHEPRVLRDTCLPRL
jgi:hypothetical protein